MSESLLRLPEVLARVHLKTTRLYQLIGDGQFPAPVRIGGHHVAWIESEVSRWIHERPRAVITTSAVRQSERAKARLAARRAESSTPEAA